MSGTVWLVEDWHDGCYHLLGVFTSEEKAEQEYERFLKDKQRELESSGYGREDAWWVRSVMGHYTGFSIVEVPLDVCRDDRTGGAS